jgi:hypothetical protein
MMSSIADSLEAGNYTVTITDNNGCTATSTHVLVSNNTDISITGTTMPNTVCANPNGSIDIETSPAGMYTYLWSNGATTEDLIGVASGSYTVMVSLGSCTASGTFFVGADAAALTLNTAVADVSCKGGNDGFIELELDGGVPPFIFNWAPPVTGSPEDLTDLFAGNYAVTVTDQAGCSIVSSFIVREPAAIVLSCNQAISVSAPGMLDGQASIDIAGGTAPYSITWTPGGHQSGVLPGVFLIVGLGEGDYQVEVTDAKGCVSTCSFTMTAEDCTTAVGSMNSQAVVLCGEACASVMYDMTSQVLNIGDIVQFILHTGAGNQIQNEIARAVQPEFCFDPATMQYNIQYYISAVAGPDDGSGQVFLNGPCDQTAPGTPVLFNEIPRASIDDPDQNDSNNPEIVLTGN